MSENGSPPGTRGVVLRIALLDVAPPLLGYYGLRACGASEHTALLAATDPKLVLAGNTIVNGVGGVLFLGSCIVGTPLTQVVAERFNSADDEAGAGAKRHIRRAHILLSAMWGLGLLAEVGARLVVISRVSVDVANGVLSAISLGTLGLLIAATIVIGRLLRARGEQRRARQG